MMKSFGGAGKALRCIAATVVAGAILAVLAALGYMYSGIYNVAATSPHGPVMAWVLHTTALHSIDARSATITVPDLSNPKLIERGLPLFRSHCVICHGAPGEPPEDFAKGLLPDAPQLAQVGRDWTSRSIFWTVAHGIKMSAMPAWEFRLTREDIWDIVAFVRSLPKLSPAQYQAMAAKAGAPPVMQGPEASQGEPGGNRARGKLALAQYACDTCHDIPGIYEPETLVGPSLRGIGRRLIIAGLLPNTPTNMSAWIRHPQQIKPHDAMPDMGVSEQDAEDMAAYLESLR